MDGWELSCRRCSMMSVDDMEEVYGGEWILHDWDDAKCIRIMQRCMEAISRNDNNKGFGKVIIIDTVIGCGSSNSQNGDMMICMEMEEAQVLCDLHMMAVSNGAEREEHEWRRIFLQAGFSDYKNTHNRGGVRSVIEVYPPQP
ncbi:hypothetical protein U9M48_001954 [Paspalum notatum var. saurae]|uniref:O-methyltransferase C-terminal domain-containing protein n=1 Tax=Paspalum notatum var. saurae TaxID=547442 RepID=A0AAQ3PH28_PASNO